MIETELFTARQGGYRCYRIPGLVVSTSGTVLALCEARRHSCKDDDDIDILLRRSFDGGRSWDDPVVVISDGDRTCGNLCPVVDRASGAIILPFSKDNQQVFVTRSEDDGETWSEPEEISNAVKAPDYAYVGPGPGHGIQLKSGRLLIPCWADIGTGPATWRPNAMGGPQLSYAFFSDDGGKSWERGEEMERGASDECEAVELNDGTIYMNMRSGGEKYCRSSARSSDGGKSWSAVEFHPELPDPSCQGSIVRLDAERVLLAHATNTEVRTHLTIRMSRDECGSWPSAKVLYEGIGAYSDLAVVGGNILCFYEKDRHERMVVARFSPDWI
jgi:sialidase-1